MEYRHMGSSDLEVSVIGFGCWEMGGGYGHFETSEVIAAIDRALDLGITLFDTARGYGTGASEELLGRALGARRQEAIVVTKGALPTREGQMDDKPTRPGLPRFNPNRDARYASVIADCEASLKSLGTDYVDLYLIHWPDPETAFEETARALQDLLAAGKARYVGVSNYESRQLREACGMAPLVANQVGYNLFDRRWEYEMMPTARELGVGIMSYGPLAHGLLTGTFNAETTFEEGDWRQSSVRRCSAPTISGRTCRLLTNSSRSLPSSTPPCRAWRWPGSSAMSRWPWRSPAPGGRPSLTRMSGRSTWTSPRRFSEKLPKS